MTDRVNTFNRAMLGGVVTVFVLFGLNPSSSITTGPIEQAQLIWAADVKDSDQDRRALEAIYHATGGDEWTHSYGWLTDAPLKNWYGLRVSNGRVVYLTLDDNNLTGEIPGEINLLEKLAVLDLRWNSLTEGLDNLNLLPDLRILKLSANNFSGEFPAIFRRLTSLEVLDVSENKLSGPIPNQLSRLTQLVAFAAHSNELTGEFPEELCNSVRSLRRLVLSDNELTGSISDIVLNCRALQHIDLANNQFDGAVPERLLSDVQLNWLDIRGNKIDEEIYASLKVNFLGIPIQPDHIGELNGLTLWGRGSFSFFYEEFRLASLRYLNAISVENGRLVLAEAQVPSELIDQAKDSILFANTYLENSDTQVRTLTDLERLLAKAEQYALTKELERLESMYPIVHSGYTKDSDASTDQWNSLRVSVHPRMFIIDTESDEITTSNSQSLTDNSTSNDQRENIDATDINIQPTKAESSSTLFAAKLSVDNLRAKNRFGIHFDVTYEYVSGQTDTLVFYFHGEIHHLQEFYGVINVTSGPKFPYLVVDAHPAKENQSFNVAGNLNFPGYYFGRFQAIPRLGALLFIPKPMEL